MAEIVTLELPETLAQQARAIAALTHRQLEDVLVEWIDRAVAEVPVESLLIARIQVKNSPKQNDGKQKDLLS